MDYDMNINHDIKKKSLQSGGQDIEQYAKNSQLNLFKRQVEELECITHSRQLNYFNLQNSTLKCSECEYDDSVDRDINQLFQTIMIAQQNYAGYRNQIEKEFRLFKQFIIEELDFMQQSLIQELSELELEIEISSKCTNSSLIELICKLDQVQNIINQNIKMKKTTKILNMMQQELYNFEQFKLTTSEQLQSQYKTIQSIAKIGSLSEHDTEVFSAIQISHNLIITSSENSLQLFRNETNKYQKNGQIQHKRVWQFKLISDENTLYMANDDGTVTILSNLKKFQKPETKLNQSTVHLRSIRIYKEAVKALEINKEENLLITGGDDKILIFWKWENQNWNKDWEFSDFNSTISCIRIDELSTVVSVGSFDGTISIFRLNQQKEFCLFQKMNLSQWIYQVSFSKQHGLMAIGSRTEDILVMREDKQHNFQVHQILKQNGTVRCVLFLGNAIGCASNQDLLSGCDDQSVRYWRCIRWRFEQALVIQIDGWPCCLSLRENILVVAYGSRMVEITKLLE